MYSRMWWWNESISFLSSPSIHPLSFSFLLNTRYSFSWISLTSPTEACTTWRQRQFSWLSGDLSKYTKHLSPRIYRVNEPAFIMGVLLKAEMLVYTLLMLVLNIPSLEVGWCTSFLNIRSWVYFLIHSVSLFSSVAWIKISASCGSHCTV